jgi:Domain of unknown function (DUF5615)
VHDNWFQSGLGLGGKLNQRGDSRVRGEMENLKFLADNDLSEHIRRGLLRLEPSIDFLGKQEGGIVGLSDPEVLRIATEMGRIVVSHDRNTMTAHFDRFVVLRTSPGLIIVPQTMDIGDAIEELLMIWACSDAGEWLNRRSFVPL